MRWSCGASRSGSCRRGRWRRPRKRSAWSRSPRSAGSYLLATQLRPPRPRRDSAGPALGPRRRPVEIAVSGAEALLAAGAAPRGAKVDVVVTTEPSGAGPGRTYVAAAGVPLLALGPGADGPGPAALRRRPWG